MDAPLGPGQASAAAAMSAASALARSRMESSSAANKKELKSQNSPMEARTILFEWPLTGLKKIFEETKEDVKSKVIRSASFGDGQWSVLFYAQSGSDQNCSIYLNADPLYSERIHPLTASARKLTGEESSGSNDGDDSAAQKKSAKKDGIEWYREGVYQFVFSILSPTRSSVIARKEAPGYTFSHTAQNWGWSGFCSRDKVYFNNLTVREADKFIIQVSLSSHPGPPRTFRPKGVSVSRTLVSAIGDLLDDPEHSDTVFLLPGKRRVSGKVVCTSAGPVRIYAIKSILAARSEYFRNMLDGGFAEAEIEASEPEERAGESGKGRRQVATPDHDAMLIDGDRTASTDVGAASGSAAIDVDGETDSEAEEDEDNFDYAADGIFADSDAGFDEAGDDSDIELIDDDEDIGAESPSQASDSGHRGAKAGASGDPAPANTSNKDSTTGERSGSWEEHDEEDAAREDEIAALSRNSGTAANPGSGADDSATRIDAHQHQSGPSEPSGEALAGHFKSLGTRAEGSAATLQARKRPASVVEREPKQRDSDMGRKRRKVTITDSEYPTFHALLYYLYTDAVDFAPLTSSFLKSEQVTSDTPDNPMRMRAGPSVMDRYMKNMLDAHKQRKNLIDSYRAQNPDKPMPCSAKAMYKLADKMNIPELKQRAKEHILKSLTEQNIIWEVFSSFTARYPEIRKIETDFVLQHWTKVKKMDAMKNLFARNAAHPGLAEVWPYLLSQLEYKKSDSEDGSSQSSENES